jgi:hypothetical protein
LESFLSKETCSSTACPFLAFGRKRGSRAKRNLLSHHEQNVILVVEEGSKGLESPKDEASALHARDRDDEPTLIRLNGGMIG